MEGNEFTKENANRNETISIRSHAKINNKKHYIIKKVAFKILY